MTKYNPLSLCLYIDLQLVIYLHLSKKNLKNVHGAMHFIYSHKYTNSTEDSSDMN